jgi:hypothetical protein
MSEPPRNRRWADESTSPSSGSQTTDPDTPEPSQTHRPRTSGPDGDYEIESDSDIPEPSQAHRPRTSGPNLDYEIESDPDTPSPSGTTESDAERERQLDRAWAERERDMDTWDMDTWEERGDINFADNSSDWSDDWDEAYLAQRRAHALRPIDRCLDACYHAIFGVAAWDATLAANLQEWPAFKSDIWAPKTLEEFYGDFAHVLHLFREHNFIEEYEKAYAEAKGTRIDFLAPTARPGHVNTRLAVRRLQCLEMAMYRRGVHVVSHRIALWTQEHGNDTAALDSAIIGFLIHWQSREPLKDLNVPIHISPVDPSYSDDEENRPPSPPPRAPRPAGPPARAPRPADPPPPPAYVRRPRWRPGRQPRPPPPSPLPPLPGREHMPAAPRLTALLSRMKALYLPS